MGTQRETERKIDREEAEDMKGKNRERGREEAEEGQASRQAKKCIYVELKIYDNTQWKVYKYLRE
jgi:hypothetical protein